MNGKPEIGVSFNPRQAVEDKAKWTEVIGKFMVAFNGIEQVIDMWIATLGSQNLYRATVEFQLSQRLPIARALGLDRAKDSSTIDRCKAAFASVASLARERNLIAHNAPVTSIYMDAEKNVELRVEVRSRRKKDKLMTIEGLTRSTEASQQLAMNLLGLMSEIMGTLPEVPPTAGAAFSGSLLDPKE
jgi:hypothetical protein